MGDSDGKARVRLVDGLLEELLVDFPAVSIRGPRACGKTTTALRFAKSVLRLDRPAENAVVMADPDAALRGLAEPILIDEWQEAPSILGALKRAVDDDSRPGRFILTGSVRGELETDAWPGTGRLVHVTMSPLCMRERLGSLKVRPFIDRVADSGIDELTVPTPALDLRDYVALLPIGGFPEPALKLGPRARPRWLRSYLEQMVTRDARLVDGGRDPTRLMRYVEVLALHTAGIVDVKTLHEAAGISRVTADAYERLASELFLVDVVPAWFTNRTKRLIKAPKRYIIDSGLAASTAKLDERTLMRDHDQLGRLLDTFVAAELRAELPVCESRPRLHHLRTEGGRQEVDLLIELSGHRVIGFEVKASSAPTSLDARHLEWLREQLGERFVHGIVFHTGPRIFSLGDRVSAVPVAAIWG